MIAFENYGLALLPLEDIKSLFKNIETDLPTAKFSDLEVRGPAIQILPLMIFV